MSEKKLLDEELNEIVGGANMSSAQFQRSCSTLSDAQLQSLLSTMSKREIQQLLGSISDPTLVAKIMPLLGMRG